MNKSNESSIDSIMDILHITSTTINLVLGVPINSWVLWLVLTGPAGTMASEFFTLDLSVCEILFSLLNSLLLVKSFVPRTYVFVIGGLMYTGRPVFQCCICVERFMAVVHPVLFLKYKPLRYRVACSAVAWLVIIGFSLSYMVRLEVVLYSYVGQCLFFISVMLLCSLAVLRALKQPMPGETSGRERERDNSMKRKAFTVICLIMGSFVGNLVIWGISLVVFARRGLLLSDEMRLLASIFGIVTVVTGLVQPLLYICIKTCKLPCVKPVQGA